MDFARKQLEKYGWTDGKGLGKRENGISQALKPKLKRSVTGVGHDAASEFNDHWWTALYDKALGNVEVKNKNGKTKKIKTKDDGEFIITNNTWKIKRIQKNNPQAEQYSEYFVRTAVLTNGVSKTEKLRDSESEEEDGKIRDVFKMTDEELFAVCEGRTAHKGARHGIKAIGKLARIAQQEAILLAQPKYNGYSHAKNLKDKIEIVEEMNLNDSTQDMEHKKKKKKRRCNSLNYKPSVSYIVDQSNEESVLDKNAMLVNDCVTSILEENEKSSKCKNNNQAIENVVMDIENDGAATSIVKSKKKIKRQADNEISAEEKKPKKRKKKMNLD